MKTYTVYHGTQYGSAAKKLRDRGRQAINFKPSAAKNPGNLGYGFYTFLSDGELAESFARKFGSNPIVFMFSVILPPEHTLAFDISAEDRQNYQKWLQLSNIQRQVNILKQHYRNDHRQKSLDGALIEAFCQMLERSGHAKIFAVRSTTYTDVGVEVPGSAIPNGVEVLIKNASVILNEHFQIYHSSEKNDPPNGNYGGEPHGKVR